MRKIKEVVIDDCPRCGLDHRKVVFSKFQGNPIEEGFLYWGWCPTYLEPIIYRVDEDEELADSRTSEEETEKRKYHTACGCTSECKDSKSCTDEAEQLPTD